MHSAGARRLHERTSANPQYAPLQSTHGLSNAAAGVGSILLKFSRLDESNLAKGSAMQVPFVTTVSFADRDGMTVRMQYGVAAPNEHEARSEL